jgi:hypothetical protein
VGDRDPVGVDAGAYPRAAMPSRRSTALAAAMNDASAVVALGAVVVPDHLGTVV